MHSPKSALLSGNATTGVALAMEAVAAFVKRNYVITALLCVFILAYACVVIIGPGETTQTRGVRARVHHSYGIHGYAALRLANPNRPSTIAKTKTKHLGEASMMVPSSVVYRTLAHLQYSSAEDIDVSEVKSRPRVAKEERRVSLVNVSDIIHMVNSISQTCYTVHM